MEYRISILRASCLCWLFSCLFSRRSFCKNFCRIAQKEEDVSSFLFFHHNHVLLYFMLLFYSIELYSMTFCNALFIEMFRTRRLKKFVLTVLGITLMILIKVLVLVRKEGIILIYQKNNFLLLYHTVLYHVQSCETVSECLSKKKKIPRICPHCCRTCLNHRYSR